MSSPSCERLAASLFHPCCREPSKSGSDAGAGGRPPGRVASLAYPTLPYHSAPCCVRPLRRRASLDAVARPLDSRMTAAAAAPAARSPGRARLSNSNSFAVKNSIKLAPSFCPPGGTGGKEGRGPEANNPLAAGGHFSGFNLQ